MGNDQIPQVQPMQPLQPAQPMGAGQQYYTAEQVAKMMEPKKDVAGLVKTIVIVLLSLVAFTSQQSVSQFCAVSCLTA